MEIPTLEDFIALNKQLAAMAEAGVSLDLGFGRYGDKPVEEIERISATVSKRVHAGESLAEALDGDEQFVPAAYHSIVQFGLRTGNISAGLAGSNVLAESVERSRHAFRAALLYPLIVCFLAYLGLVGFVLFYVPTVEATYEGLRIPPGKGLLVLQALRDTRWQWIWIPPDGDF